MSGRDDYGRGRPDLSAETSGPPDDGDVVDMSGHGDGDVVEIGNRRSWVFRRPFPLIFLSSAGLLVGLVAGFAAGDAHGRSAGAPARPSGATTPTPPMSGGGLGQTGNECSMQAGRTLQLGVQVMNLSARGIVLQEVKAILPIGGLKQTAQAWGPCGELPPLSELPDDAMPAGGSTWFTVTFQVLVKCPYPLPVQFTVDYALDGRPASTTLPGFPDLGHVPYANCPSA
ncbi:MAG TPA: hypothetical protein VKV33_09240 [Streptosporangiaceae bacterium]|nr:hypothetical protein [Streptosporangiaceae bacterium]